MYLAAPVVLLLCRVLKDRFCETMTPFHTSEKRVSLCVRTHLHNVHELQNNILLVTLSASGS
jgi:hypothetical protein